MQIRTFKVLASSLGSKESDSPKGQPLAIEYQETTVGRRVETSLPLSFLPLTNKNGEVYPIQNVKKRGRPTLSATINLRNAVLSNMDFQGFDLNKANLKSANLRGAKLSLANLNGADLQNADLKKADLREANFYGADLNGADLRRANLTGATLTNAKFSRDTTKF